MKYTKILHNECKVSLYWELYTSQNSFPAPHPNTVREKLTVKILSPGAAEAAVSSLAKGTAEMELAFCKAESKKSPRT